MISGNNKAKRVQWCTNDFPAITWQSVVFSYEANMSLYWNKVKVWTKYPKRKIPSPTKALSIGVWGAFSSRGIFPLKIFYRKFGCEQNCAILGECLIEQANVLHPDGWKLLHDNATAHTGRVTRQWMAEQSVEAIPWPSASQDLNPIENLLKLLKDRVERTLPKTKEQFISATLVAWNEITMDTLQNLINSMQGRALQCQDRHGSAIEY